MAVDDLPQCAKTAGDDRLWPDSEAPTVGWRVRFLR